MAGTKATLLSIGVTEEQIKMEEFTMIADKGFWPAMKYVSYAVGLAAVVMMLPLSLIYSSAASTVAPGAGSIFSASSPYGTANIYKVGLQMYKQAATHPATTSNQSPTADMNVNPSPAPTTDPTQQLQPSATQQTPATDSQNNFEDD